MWIPAQGIVSSGEAYWNMNLGNDVTMPMVVKEALVGEGTNKNYEAKSGKPPANVQYLNYKPPTNDVNMKYKPPTNDVNIEYKPPTNDVNMKYKPPTNDVNMKDKPPTNDVNMKYKPPTNDVNMKYKPPANDVNIEYNPPANDVNMKYKPPTNDVNMKYKPPANDVNIEYKPPANDVNMKYKPPTNDVNMKYKPPTNDVNMKYKPPANDVNMKYKPPTNDVNIEYKPPTNDVKMKYKPLLNDVNIEYKPLAKGVDIKTGLARSNRPTLSYNTRGSKVSISTDYVQYFFEKELVNPGSKMKLLFSMAIKEAKFKPFKEANSIPFSSNKLPEILQIFAIKPKSAIANVIKETLSLCENKPLEGEQKFCATSLEAIVNYAKSRLGDQVNVLSTEVDKDTIEEYKIGSAKKIKSAKNLVCHKMVYPFAVFYCHTLSKTDAYQVSLVDGSGKKVKAIAVCHKDTSSWYSGHLAFQLLKVKPGSVPICHFLNPNAMIWVSK